jgi:hypothetical protein
MDLRVNQIWRQDVYFHGTIWIKWKTVGITRIERTAKPGVSLSAAVPYLQLWAVWYGRFAGAMSEVRRPFLGTVCISTKPAGVRRPTCKQQSGLAIVDPKKRCRLNWRAELDYLSQWEADMSAQRIFGFVLLIIGVILMIVGLNASHSAADQISNTFTGKFTHQTAWYIFGGGAAALLGLLMVVFGVRGSDAWRERAEARNLMRRRQSADGR